MPHDTDVLVLGSGVIGLTTAVVLAEAGLRTLVWTRDRAAHTTSALAGALWGPYRAEPPDQVYAWSARTYAVHADLAADPDSTGVRLVPGVQAHPVHVTLPWWADAIPDLRLAAADELPRMYRSGWRARLPLVDMPVHLTYLETRLHTAGGRLEQRTVANLDEARGHAPILVNATGLGAAELVDDPHLYPIQGHLVLVENPGIDHWFIEETRGATENTYVFPHPAYVVLGGTARPHIWDTISEPTTGDAILNRCVRVFPQLARARVLAHRVGLRPARATARLERQRLAEDLTVIHSYGHGGAGVTTAWGVAEQVRDLVLDHPPR